MRKRVKSSLWSTGGCPLYQKRTHHPQTPLLFRLSIYFASNLFYYICSSTKAAYYTIPSVLERARACYLAHRTEATELSIAFIFFAFSIILQGYRYLGILNPFIFLLLLSALCMYSVHTGRALKVQYFFKMHLNPLFDICIIPLIKELGLIVKVTSTKYEGNCIIPIYLVFVWFYTYCQKTVHKCNRAKIWKGSLQVLFSVQQGAHAYWSYTRRPLMTFQGFFYQLGNY